MHLRIVRTRYKVLYIVVGLGLELFLGFAVLSHWPIFVRALVGQVFVYGFYLIAVRSFRSSKEAVEPPRPWWRVTGGVASGFVLAGLHLLFAAMNVLDFIGISPGEAPARSGSPYAVADAVSWALLAAAYVNSSVRLHRWLIQHPERTREVVTTSAPIKGLE